MIFGLCETFGPGDNYATGIFSADHAYEAWERMTYGGVQLGDLGFQHVHRRWGSDSIGVSHGYQIPSLLRRTANGIQALRVAR